MTTILDLIREPLVDARDIAHRFTALEQAFPEGDGVRWFCTAHVAMSWAVADVVEEADFEDDEMLEQLDLHLVRAFFDVLAVDQEEGAGETRKSWRPLFERRADPDVGPVRFALAGINAHIATDLARAVLQTCLDAGVEVTRDSAFYRDYCRINEMETELRTSVEEQVFGPLMRAVDEAMGEVDDAVETFGFCAAREAAWISADIASALPGPARDLHLATLDRTTGFVNKVMLLG